MTIRKTTKRTAKSTSKSAVQSKKTGFIITLTVQNGPFKSQEQARSSRTVLKNRGIIVSDVAKTSAGYKFVSVLNYSVPSVPIRDRVTRQLRAHAAALGVPKSAISLRIKRI